MAFEDILQSILGDEYTGTPSGFGGNDWTFNDPSDDSGILGATDFNFWDFLGDDTGNDWSLPVGSETGDDFTVGDMTSGDDRLSDFWGGMGDDWWTPVGSETGDPITGVNYGNTFLDDLLAGILQPGTSDPAAGGDEELTWWQKLIGKGGGPFGGSILGPQGEGNTQGVLGGLLSLLGIGGGGGILGGGAGEAGGGLGGLFGSNPLMAFLMAKSLMKDEQTPSDVVPIGQQAFGGEGAYNMPDYRVTNLQPALMPGIGYANMATPQQPPPPNVGIPQPQPQQPRGYNEGGITSLSKGPGDITLAKLEPGEFVMTRKATQNIGAKNLYDLMKRAEGRGG